MASPHVPSLLDRVVKKPFSIPGQIGRIQYSLIINSHGTGKLCVLHHYHLLLIEATMVKVTHNRKEQLLLYIQ